MNKMTFDQFESDLPRHRRITFSSAEENEEAMRDQGVTQELRQLGSGQFRCSMVTNETEQVALFSDRFNKAFSMYLAPPADTVAFLISRSASGEFYASGENLGNEKLAILFPESGADIVVPALIGSESFVIAKARFAELTETLCPTMARCETMEVFRGDTAELGSLRNELLYQASRSKAELTDEDTDNLIARVIGWLGSFAGGCDKERVRASVARTMIAKRAQEFIHDNYQSAVRIEDLCHVTNSSIRTLQKCFKYYFGITISDYLKTVRLEAARRELAATDPSHITVTKIALRNGFRHLGRFSVEFRRRYGESPSETLAT